MKNAESGFKLPAGEYNDEQVLNDVIERIEQEPKRLYMPAWVGVLRGRFAKGVQRTGWGGLTEDVMPACKTAACVGGHIGLTFGKRVKCGADALRLLRLPVTSICGPSEVPFTPEQKAGWELNVIFGQTGTKADQIVSELKAFVKKHRDVLRRTKVTVKTREELREEVRQGRGR